MKNRLAQSMFDGAILKEGPHKGDKTVVGPTNSVELGIVHFLHVFYRRSIYNKTPEARLGPNHL